MGSERLLEIIKRHDPNADVDAHSIENMYKIGEDIVQILSDTATANKQVSIQHFCIQFLYFYIFYYLFVQGVS